MEEDDDDDDDQMSFRRQSFQDLTYHRSQVTHILFQIIATSGVFSCMAGIAPSDYKTWRNIK